MQRERTGLYQVLSGKGVVGVALKPDFRDRSPSIRAELVGVD